MREIIDEDQASVLSYFIQAAKVESSANRTKAATRARVRGS